MLCVERNSNRRQALINNPNDDTRTLLEIVENHTQEEFVHQLLAWSLHKIIEAKGSMDIKFSSAQNRGVDCRRFHRLRPYALRQM